MARNREPAVPRMDIDMNSSESDQAVENACAKEGRRLIWHRCSRHSVWGQTVDVPPTPPSVRTSRSSSRDYVRPPWIRLGRSSTIAASAHRYDAVRSDSETTTEQILLRLTEAAVKLRNHLDKRCKSSIGPFLPPPASFALLATSISGVCCSS